MTLVIVFLHTQSEGDDESRDSSGANGAGGGGGGGRGDTRPPDEAAVGGDEGAGAGNAFAGGSRRIGSGSKATTTAGVGTQWHGGVHIPAATLAGAGAGSLAADDENAEEGRDRVRARRATARNGAPGAPPLGARQHASQASQASQASPAAGGSTSLAAGSSLSSGAASSLSSSSLSAAASLCEGEAQLLAMLHTLVELTPTLAGEADAAGVSGGDAASRHQAHLISHGSLSPKR